MMIQPLRRELSELLGKGCMVKTAAGEDAMFVTDAPRRLTAQALADAEATMHAKGFLHSEAGKDLWTVDPDETRWQTLLAGTESETDCPFPDDDRLHELYSVARLLAAHPSPWFGQPRGPIRAMLKRYDRPQELLRYAPILRERCAILLRGHRALPSSAAGLLFHWLARYQGGERI